MPGETQDAQALWNEMAREREAAADDAPPSNGLLTSDPLAEGQKAEDAELPADPAPEADKAPETPAPAETAQTPAEDPFAGLSPAVRAKLEELDGLRAQVAQIPELVNTVKAAQGRVAAMQREMDVAKQAAKAASDAAPSQAQIAAASGDVKKWDALKSDFPEWAEATEQYVAAKLAGLTPKQAEGLSQEQVQQLVAQAEARAETRAQARALAAIEEAKVELKYQDWAQTVTSAEFKAWHAAQPPEVQMLAKSRRGMDAVRLLDLYAERVQPGQDPSPSEVQLARTKRLSAAVNTQPGSQATPSKSVDEMTPAELWEHERKRASRRGAERGLVY